MNLALGRVSTRLRRWLGRTVRNDPELAPVLGEYAWHSLTLDPRLAEVSEEHFSVVAKILAHAGFDGTKNARKRWMRAPTVGREPSTSPMQARLRFRGLSGRPRDQALRRGGGRVRHGERAARQASNRGDAADDR